MDAGDRLIRLVFRRFPVRGAIIRLEDSWQPVRDRNPAPEPVRELLGQALGASALMTGNIKFDGRVGLQLQGDSPINLLLAQCTSEGGLRGIVRADPAVDPEVGFADLTGEGVLTVTIDQTRGQRFQGIVPVDGGSLAAALESYFRQSEQLPTRFWLACGEDRVAGLVLQKMPDDGGSATDPDGWNRVVQLAETLTVEELLGLASEQVLHRLFHEERLSVHVQNLRFECSCSQERALQVLESLGREEVWESLGSEGEVTVDCEFCNARYSFDRVDLEALFNPNSVAAASETRQ